MENEGRLSDNHTLPLYSMVLWFPRPLRAVIESHVIIFHDIPCYSKVPMFELLFICYSTAFYGIPRPLQALIEFIFRLYSILFHGIPRCSQALAGEDWVGGLGFANLEACPKVAKSDRQQ